MKRQKTKSTDKIIEASRKLFYKNGISPVTVKKICALAGISKMTFYRHFRDKDAVAFIIVKEIYKEAWEKFYVIFNKNITFERKLKEVLEMKIDLVLNFSAEFLNDIMTSKIPEIEKFIIRQTNQSLKKTKEIFENAKENGEIRKDVPIETMVVILNSMREVFFKLNNSEYYKDNNSEIFNDMFKVLYLGILSREKK
ncbi:MAG: TetR/AcrR family transcriptional regulator [Elusimicrobia bacterium]|jgi:AcrR family transcriptional regulator|nr:TetR/AcrR family transcriptional regulator [Elusimicrobiota bacterium]